MRERCLTYVDAELKAKFLERFGDYGAISFVLEAALSELLDATEGQPNMEELVRQGIKNHVLRNQFQPKTQN